jgi:hypothetical protein
MIILMMMEKKLMVLHLNILKKESLLAMFDKSMSILLKKKLQEQNKPVKNRKWQNK